MGRQTHGKGTRQPYKRGKGSGGEWTLADQIQHEKDFPPYELPKANAKPQSTWAARMWMVGATVRVPDNVLRLLRREPNARGSMDTMLPFVGIVTPDESLLINSAVARDPSNRPRVASLPSRAGKLDQSRGTLELYLDGLHILRRGPLKDLIGTAAVIEFDSQFSMSSGAARQRGLTYSSVTDYRLRPQNLMPYVIFPLPPGTEDSVDLGRLANALMGRHSGTLLDVNPSFHAETSAFPNAGRLDGRGEPTHTWTVDPAVLAMSLLPRMEL